MNRKQKIIVSITGIILVSLILIGLTYAYFLTKITGNTNSKSISVTTANLAIVYEDNSAEILGKDLILEPNSEKEIGTKTFTVTNKGNAKTSYVVVIDETKITNATDGTTTTFESNDFRYTLTCTEGCNGVETQSVFPINGGILVGNSIDVGIVQTYELKLWYIDTGIDQTNDMNKRLEARVNITDITQMENPYLANTNSLAYNIIENAKNKINGTELVSSPKTKPAEESSGEYWTGKFEEEKEEELDLSNYIWYIGSTPKVEQGGTETYYCSNSLVGKYIVKRGFSTSYLVKSCKSSSVAVVGVGKGIMNYEKELSNVHDDYGISYYYRGNVEDNYVNFAGMCWRIVRIVGDGSIKLILEDQDSTCETSDATWSIPTTTGGTTKSGNFGYTNYAANTLTASDKTKNRAAIQTMNYLNGGTNNDKSMATAFKNFQTGPLANYLDKLKAGDWCLNDKAYATSSDNTTALTSQEILDKQIKGTTFYYDSYVRLSGKATKEPTLKCNGTTMTKFVDNTDMYVGTLTADEVMYAGGKIGNNNSPYYLFKGDTNWTTLSPGYYDNSSNMDTIINVYYSGSIGTDFVMAASFRPAIQLKSDVQISKGNGNKENPYTVKFSS